MVDQIQFCVWCRNFLLILLHYSFWAKNEHSRSCPKNCLLDKPVSFSQLKILESLPQQCDYCTYQIFGLLLLLKHSFMRPSIQSPFIVEDHKLSNSILNRNLLCWRDLNEQARNTGRIHGAIKIIVPNRHSTWLSSAFRYLVIVSAKNAFLWASY